MRRALLAVLAVVVGSALIAAPGAAAETSTLNGTGADSIDPLLGKWQQAVAKEPLSIKVDYSADGSGSGRKEFIQNKLDFVITSVGFSEAQEQQLADEQRTYVSIPFGAGSIALLYHLFTPQGDPIKGIQLSGPTITKIFTGTITNWNDPLIAAENPSLTLPAVRIIPTVRGQESGATYTMTSFMKDQDPDTWHTFMSDPSRNFPDDPVELFPFFAGVDSRTSSFAVADVVRGNESSNGRIAYVDTAWAVPATDEGADIVKVKNAAGKYVLPSVSNAQTTIDTWTMDDDAHLTPNYRVADSAAYPLGIVHEIVLPTSGLAAEKAAALRSFVQYALQDGQKLAAGVGDPQLPAAVVTKSLVILDTEIPPPTTTTTSSTTAPVSTDVLANSETSAGSVDGTALAYTGNPALGWPLAVGGALVLVGTALRRRRAR